MTDTITLHVASVDSASKPYGEISATTISAFAGHESVQIKVLGVFKSPVAEDDEKTFIDGEVIAGKWLRHTFDVQVKPFSYRSSEWDLSDWDTIETFISKVRLYNNAWIDCSSIAAFLGYSSSYHAEGSVLPVRLVGISFTDNDGFKEVTLNFKKAWRV